MKSLDSAESNVAKIAALFPQCVTERIGKSGTAELAIDFDKLRDELSKDLLDGAEERYQFTWPDKRVASRLANEATDKTLRPDLDASEDFWNTKNLYIEGDNLDVLKVLRENYLGAIKMIYIDPPYNTGNDLVYNDDFAQSLDDYEAVSGAFDEEGNQLRDPMQRNTESNGRFHTDWLNMIYPRLKVARDLLSDEGVIFISIGDNEIVNLRKICDEVFFSQNFIAEFIWKSKLGKVGTTSTISATHEYILCYAKKIDNVKFSMITKISEGRKENLRQWGVADRREDRPSMYYPITIDGVTVYPIKDDGSAGRWRVGQDMANDLLNNGELILTNNKGKYGIQRIFPDGISYTAYDTLLLDNIGTTAKGAKILNELGMSKIFDFSKPIELIKHFVHLVNDVNAIILDFFSGSASTAHAVMKLNAEDGGHRKFIMVQLPEVTNKNSEARKAGYETICQIGEERIRRAGKQIRSEIDAKIASNEAAIKRFQSAKPSATVQLFLKEDQEETAKEFYLKNIKPLEDENIKLLKLKEDLDTGFRVLKIDSSNMEDVFYTPEDFDARDIFNTVDNVKPNRTPLDLLFQVLPELNIELSAKIEEKEVSGKNVFFVDDNYLIATFDTEVNESTVTEIAKMKPQYFVMRDASAANDNVLDNFDQIFRHYSPDTIRKIL